MNAFDFLREWYQSQCDGDWEHQYGVSIKTIDNPGWQITVDLMDTSMEEYAVDYTLVDNGEDDWFGYAIKDHVFSAAGGVNKLQVLLETFRKIAETGTGGVGGTKGVLEI